MKLRYVALILVILGLGYFLKEKITQYSYSSSSGGVELLEDGQGDSEDYYSDVEVKTYSRYEISKAFKKEIPNCLIDSVISFSEETNIDPLWIFCLIDNESGFKYNISNKHSGAYGYIQFMPIALKDIGYTVGEVKSMDECEQFEVVRAYIKKDIKRNSDHYSFVDLYLGILYPKFRNSHESEKDITMFQNPKISYKQNKWLDSNKDGKVTRNEFARLMYKKYNRILKIKYEV